MVRAVAAQQQTASASALSVVIRSSALCPPTSLQETNQNATELATPLWLSLHRLRETHTNIQLAAAPHKEHALRRRCQRALSGRAGPANNEVPFQPHLPHPSPYSPPHLAPKAVMEVRDLG